MSPSLLDSLRPPSRTSPEPPPGPDSDPEPVAALPGFLPTRAPMPGPSSPDEPGPDLTSYPTDHGGAADDGGLPSSVRVAHIPDFFKARAKSYGKIAGALLAATGGWLNRIFDDLDSGAFIPDEDDLSDIPPPLGRLAARRIKLGADPSKLTDLEDMGMAAVGVGVWLAKGVTATMNARQLRRRAEAGRAVHQDEGTDQ